MECRFVDKYLGHQKYRWVEDMKGNPWNKLSETSRKEYIVDLKRYKEELTKELQRISKEMEHYGY